MGLLSELGFAPTCSLNLARFREIDGLLPQYVHEGKAHLMVGIGCTGGRHRSVAIAERLAAHYREHGDYTVGVSHRDIDKPPRG